MATRKLTRKDLRRGSRRNTRTGAGGDRTTRSARSITPLPEDIVAAARLVRKGKVISLALNFDQHGPQGAKSKYPALGRINPDAHHAAHRHRTPTRACSIIAASAPPTTWW
mgnify:CR=1 FL=1